VAEAVDLGAENDERMARLREALTLGTDFQLVIVQVEPGEQREEVLRRLSGWAGRSGVPRLDLVRVAKGESPVMRLLGGHDGVILVGLEDGLEGPVHAVPELNWSRDRLPELVHGPLVLVVSQRVQTALFEQAPDLYSWRVHSTHITPQAETTWGQFWRLEAGPEAPPALEAMIGEVSSLRPLPVLELAHLHGRLALAHAVRGDFSAAEAAFDAAYEGYVRAGRADNSVMLLLQRSTVERNRGHLDNAASWIERARREAITLEALTPRTEASLISATAMIALDRGDLETAAIELPRAVAAFQSIRDYGSAASLVVDQSELAFHRGDTPTSRALLEQSLALYHRAGDLRGEANVLTVSAIQSLMTGRSDDAEKFGAAAVARAEASGFADTVAFARANLGRIALANHHWELAAETLSHGSTALELDDSAELAEMRGRLALHDGDQPTAKRYLQAALEGYRRRGRTWNVADVSLELGELGRRMKDWTLALTSFETAGSLGDPRQRAVAALGLAQLAFDREERTAALADQFASATQQLVAVGDATRADTARQYRGVVLLALARNAEAREELEAALSGFQARGQAENATRVQDVLGRIEGRSQIT